MVLSSMYKCINYTIIQLFSKPGCTHKKTFTTAPVTVGSICSFAALCSSARSLLTLLVFEFHAWPTASKQTRWTIFEHAVITLVKQTQKWSKVLRTDHLPSLSSNLKQESAVCMVVRLNCKIVRKYGTASYYINFSRINYTIYNTILGQRLSLTYRYYTITILNIQSKILYSYLSQWPYSKFNVNIIVHSSELPVKPMWA